MAPCGACGGKGFHSWLLPWPRFTCDRCLGTGRSTCPTCKGSGLHPTLAGGETPGLPPRRLVRVALALGATALVLGLLHKFVDRQGLQVLIDGLETWVRFLDGEP